MSNAGWINNVYRRLKDYYGVELDWGKAANRSKPSPAMWRREIALARSRRERGGAAVVPKVKSRRRRGRPKKLDYVEELGWAVSVAFHMKMGKMQKVASGRNPGISRATIFRIQRKHKERAEALASLLVRSGQRPCKAPRRFKRYIDSRTFIIGSLQNLVNFETPLLLTGTVHVDT